MKIVLVSLLMATVFIPTTRANWPAWRGGAHGSGVTTETNLPLVWNSTDNVRWQVPLPDRGNSTPIVWGNKIFVSQVLEKTKRRTLMCLDRADGRLLWERGVSYTKPEKSHPTNPYCSASPVTDGERVIVTFGSAGVYCYDLDGKELWTRDLGPQEHEWGNSSSPVLHENLCFIYHGPGKNSLLVALDKTSGKTVWQYREEPWVGEDRTDGFAGRKGVVGSFSTPIVTRHNRRDELIMSFPERIRAFDPATGRELWQCGGLNPLVYSSPIEGNGVVVAMGGFNGTTVAVAAGGSGDVTQQRLWQAVRTANRLGSGVIKDNYLYILNTAGIAECIELKTGKVVWEERIKGAGATSESWSSMLLAGDRLYILNRSGETLVLRASPKFELLAVNSLNSELTNASLAASNGEFFIRTHKTLWCIGGGAAVGKLD